MEGTEYILQIYRTIVYYMYPLGRVRNMYYRSTIVYYMYPPGRVRDIYYRSTIVYHSSFIRQSQLDTFNTFQLQALTTYSHSP